MKGNIILIILISIILSGCGAVQPATGAVMPSNWMPPVVDDVRPLMSGTVRQILLNVIRGAPGSGVWMQGPRAVFMEVRNGSYYFTVLDSSKWVWIRQVRDLCGQEVCYLTWKDFAMAMKNMGYQSVKFGELTLGMRQYIQALTEAVTPGTVVKVGAAAGAAAQAAANKAAPPSMFIMTFVVGEMNQWFIREIPGTIRGAAMNYEPELKLCPFCGCKGKLHAEKKFNDLGLIYWIECEDKNCGGSSGYDLGWSGAAELWNRRVVKDDYWTLHNSPPKHEPEVQQ